MGMARNFERLDDFIQDAKERGLKSVFYILGQSSQENQTSSVITLSVISEDGKVYLTHREVAASILLSDKTTDDEVAAFNAAGEARLKEVYLTLQKDFPSADLKVGLCAPTEA